MRLLPTIIILNLSLLFAFNLGLAPVQADITFKPNVTFGPLTKGVDYTINPNSIGNYVLGIYKFAINIVGILAVVVMMWGGLTWITAGGNAGRIDSAKAWIGAAFTGLVLTLASYTILMTINPALVRFESLNPQKIANILPATEKEMALIRDKCEKECLTGYSYDPKNDKCNCYGSGTHRECQKVAGTSSDSYQCVTVNFPGQDTCTSDTECRQNLGCCRCIWKSMGVTFNTSCTSGTMFTTSQSCKNHCGLFPNWQFTPGAICNSGKQCVIQ